MVYHGCCMSQRTRVQAAGLQEIGTSLQRVQVRPQRRGHKTCCCFQLLLLLLLRFGRRAFLCLSPSRCDRLRCIRFPCQTCQQLQLQPRLHPLAAGRARIATGLSSPRVQIRTRSKRLGTLPEREFHLHLLLLLQVPFISYSSLISFPTQTTSVDSLDCLFFFVHTEAHLLLHSFFLLSSSIASQ